jgi:hypothetical protein
MDILQMTIGLESSAFEGEGARAGIRKAVFRACRACKRL